LGLYITVYARFLFIQNIIERKDTKQRSLNVRKRRLLLSFSLIFFGLLFETAVSAVVIGGRGQFANGELATGLKVDTVRSTFETPKPLILNRIAINVYIDFGQVLLYTIKQRSI
jgi:hypothetical protein